MLYIFVFVCALSTPQDECFFENAVFVLDGPTIASGSDCEPPALKFIAQVQQDKRFDSKKHRAVWSCSHAD